MSQTIASGVGLADAWLADAWLADAWLADAWLAEQGLLGIKNLWATLAPLR